MLLESDPGLAGAQVQDYRSLFIDRSLQGDHHRNAAYSGRL
jgi:hypothetical protein